MAKRDDQIRNESLRRGTRQHTGDRARDPRSIFPHHRQNRAKLNDDLKYFGFVVVESQPIADNDEMPGAGDGQKFRRTFDDAQDEGVN